MASSLFFHQVDHPADLEPLRANLPFFGKRSLIKIKPAPIEGPNQLTRPRNSTGSTAGQSCAENPGPNSAMAAPCSHMPAAAADNAGIPWACRP